MPTRAGARVVALVAAYQEEASIARTVAALAAVPGVDRVVVISDGSGDGTAQEAAGAGARVLVAPRRMGKGGAIEGALDRAGPADVYLLVDADVGETAGEVRMLLAEVIEGRLDLAIGRLPTLGGGGLGMVKAAAGWAVRAASGYGAEEPLSGQRAITARALQACRPLARGFGVETAMTIDAVRLGFRVGEIPVAMGHRTTGRGPAGFLHRAGQGMDVLRAVAPRLARLR